MFIAALPWRSHSQREGFTKLSLVSRQAFALAGASGGVKNVINLKINRK